MNIKASSPRSARRIPPGAPKWFSLALVIVALLGRGVVASAAPASTIDPDRKDLIGAVKRLEKKLGLRRTKNFKRQTTETAVAYRCYYTGKLELPASYSQLNLIQGTERGCPLNPEEFDVFFYPLEASGSGKTPVSASLAHESVERFLVVMPHEDVHASKELRKLPETLGEAYATLIGFLTAAEVAREQFGEDSEIYRNLRREPEIFARKAEMVNRYHAQLSELYAAVRAGRISERDALAQKQQTFEEIRQACAAGEPGPKTFNKCLSVSNNAGLAFDETYAKYYPVLYQLYVVEGRNLKSTLNTLHRALEAKTEAEAFQNLQKAVASAK